MHLSLPQFKDFPKACTPSRKGRCCKSCRAKGKVYADWREGQTGMREFACPFAVDAEANPYSPAAPAARAAVSLPVWVPPTTQEVERLAKLPCKLRSEAGECLVCGCRTKNKQCFALIAEGQCPSE